MAIKKAGTTAVWVIMALLVLGLGGFGVTNFSGRVTSIGTVGGKQIDIDYYGRALQEEMRTVEAQTGKPLTLEDARRMGIVDSTLSKIVTNRALDAENDRLGISVGDDTLSRQVQAIQAFQGVDGKFDREAYKSALARVGMNESTFETRLREETARSILQTAIVAGAGMPETYSDTVIGFVAEKRKVTWAKLDQDSLDEPLPEPTEDELKAFYDAHQDRYMIPERKKITYALLSPDSLMDGIEIDEATLRRAYDERKSEFERPARRLVERLVFPDEAAAEAAKARLDKGEVEFDALVEERGLSLSDIDMGDVTQPELGAAGDAVFAAQSGEVVGPLQSDLGPALFRINGIFPAQTTSYEDAVGMLRDELVADQARRKVEAQMEPVEDLLAGGATLEDLAKETQMTLGTIDWYQGIGEGIAAYDGFDAAAAKLEKDAYPELQRLDDGGIFAMRLDGTLPSEVAPYDQVAERVRAGWENEETLKRLRAKAESLQTRLQESATFESLGLDAQTEDLSRSGSALGAPEEMVKQAFSMKPGEIGVTEGFGAVQVFRVDEVIAPDESDPKVAQFRRGLNQAASQSIGQDLYRAVATDIRERVGVRLDQSAINAVLANFRQ